MQRICIDIIASTNPTGVGPHERSLYYVSGCVTLVEFGHKHFKISKLTLILTKFFHPGRCVLLPGTPRYRHTNASEIP